jgi:hypothetical protein
MPQVHTIYIVTARPMNDSDPGRAERGWFVLEHDTVTLTDQDGEPLKSGRLQNQYSRKLREGERPDVVAQRLLYDKWQASRAGNDFNRAIHYPNTKVWR